MLYRCKFGHPKIETQPRLEPRRAALLCLAAFAAMAALSVAVPFGDAKAQVLCTEPLQPACLREGSNFESETIRRRCITDIETYLDKIDEFIECTRQKIEESMQTKEQAKERMKEIEEQLR